MEKIGIIGAGITGLFSALNLSLDNYDVTLFERDNLLSGTSGRFHGMLHSGSRYSLTDENSARECINENKLLNKNAGNFIKNTSGYFVSLNDDDSSYGDKLFKKNKNIGIETENINVNELLKIEPYLNKDIKMALKVPDKIIYAHPFASAVAMEAILNGAKIRFNSEITGSEIKNNNVISVKYKKGNNIISEKFDYIINTTGPWSGKLLKNFNIKNFDIMPTLGYMASYDRLFINSIINRMRDPSDGDILLPYGSKSVAGTIAIISEDPDNNELDDEDIDTMISEIAEMVPSIKDYKYKKLYYSMRPLIKEDNSRNSRDFNIYKNYDNMITIIGGKFTTSRLMGKSVSEYISKIFGNKSSDTKNIIFDNTFNKFISKYKNNIDTSFLDYINSYDNSMDYEYKLHIESAFLLNEAVKVNKWNSMENSV